jgi:hypothetical protein
VRPSRERCVIDIRDACKIDLIGRRERAFSREELSRRVVVELSPGRMVWIVTPEDAVLSKLEWARRAGDSERQIADAAGVVAVKASLDRAYIERWAQELGVIDLWRGIARGGVENPGGTCVDAAGPCGRVEMADARYRPREKAEGIREL